MARNTRTFSPEFREDTAKLVIDSSRPIAQVARELGIGEATLDGSDRARLREVERQLREVKMENEFLKKVASYFAQDHR